MGDMADMVNDDMPDQDAPERVYEAMCPVHGVRGVMSWAEVTACDQWACGRPLTLGEEVDTNG